MYHDYTTCVCFMGEGDGSEESRAEMLSYVKVRSYREEFGSLTSETTNQRMWMKEADKYIDITERFWRA